VGPADVDEVGADDVFGVGAMVLTEETDEGFVRVGLFESGVDLLWSDFLGEFDERGGADAGVDGHEVGDEGEWDGLASGEIEFLADFAEMAMAGDAVGAEGAVDLTEEKGDAGVASGTTGPAHAGDVDGLIEVDETGAKERDEGEEDAGGVTTRAGDEACGLDFLGADFWKRVDGFGEEFGVRMGVIVELGVGFRRTEAEVGAEVDDAKALIEQRLGEGGGDAMREGEESDLGAGLFDEFDIGLDEGEGVDWGDAAEAGELGAEEFASEGAGRDGDEFDTGVAQDEAKQLDA
jgi:hypothetical protein